MEDARNACYIFVGKPQEKRPLRRHRHRWKDNIEVDHDEQQQHH
jgi:hypothetical protein